MSNDPTREILPNEDLDLTGTQMGRPLLKGPVRSTVKECFWEKKDIKGQPGKQLTIVLVTAEPATSTTGTPVPEGLETEVNILATPTGKLTQEMINRKIAFFQCAALGIEKPTNFKAEEMVGKELKPMYEVEAGRRQDPVTGQWVDDPSKMYQRVGRWEKVS